MLKFKLLVVYEMPIQHEMFWDDGLAAALRVLGKDWEVLYLNSAREGWEKRWWDLQNKADFVLGWGGPSSKHFNKLYARAVAGRAGWCFGGGDLNEEMLDKFPVVFVEVKEYLIKPNFKLAFGTNTDLFRNLNTPKIIDALYPAAFANWKEQIKFAEICRIENLKGLCVGYIQQNNPDESFKIIDEVTKLGTSVMDWVHPSTLTWIYNMSKEVIVTANASGGSERAVLEAKACEVPVRLATSSPKLLELGKLSSQEVQENFNHHTYAKQLKEGIEACMPSS